MTATIDLNADMGEYHDSAGLVREDALMKYISSCSIACGGHAGDAETMATTINRARNAGVAIGAHPSYPDRENFGRQSLDLDPTVLRRTVMEQLTRFISALSECGAKIAHVKPHGALYNDAAKSKTLSAIIAGCVSRIAPQAALMGPPASALETAARAENLQFIPEGFIDRLYREDGALTPRSEPGAVLQLLAERTAQALAIARQEPVRTSGAPTIIKARSLCIHSDSPGAVETAAAVRAAIIDAGFAVRAAS